MHGLLVSGMNLHWLRCVSVHIVSSNVPYRPCVIKTGEFCLQFFFWGDLIIVPIMFIHRTSECLWVLRSSQIQVAHSTNLRFCEVTTLPPRLLLKQKDIG